MSRVLYDSQRLIPAPIVSISKQYNRAADGTKLGSNYNLTLIGKCLPQKGSPMQSGEFWTAGGFPPDYSGVTDNNALGILLAKQAAIKELFSNDFRMLEFQTEDASFQSTKCNPQVVEISFSEGPWVQYFDYSVTLNAPVLYINGSGLAEDDVAFIESASETWDIQPEDEYETVDRRIFKVTHSVSAKGIKHYDETGTLVNDAYEEAKAFVLPKLGFNSAMVNSSAGIPELDNTYNAYSFARSENLDLYGGAYSVTENWTMASGSAIETFDISTQSSSDSNLTQVTIQGSIAGLEQRNSNMDVINSRYANANAKFSSISGVILSRAQTYSNVSLNVIPLVSSVGRNPHGGTLTYSYEYNNRPSNVIANSRSESIVVSDSLQTDYPVPIFVLGRVRGPVIQNLYSSRERTRTLTIEAVVPSSGIAQINSNPRTLGQIDTVIVAATPTGETVLVSEKNETWDCLTGRYSFNISWIYE